MTSRIPELCKPWVLTQQVQNHNQWSVTARSQHWGKDSAGRLENWRKKEYLDVLTWTRSSRTSFVASNTKTLGFSRCPCDTPCSRVGWTSWAGLCIVCASFVSVQCTCFKRNHKKSFTFVVIWCKKLFSTYYVVQCYREKKLPDYAIECKKKIHSHSTYRKIIIIFTSFQKKLCKKAFLNQSQLELVSQLDLGACN